MWVDGAPATHLPLPDRGLSFGDGLFETLLLYKGRAVLPEYHWQRLERGLGVLGIPLSRQPFDQAVSTAQAAVSASAAALRITITRGDGPRGYAAPAAPVPRVISQLTPLAVDPLAWASPARLGLSTIRWGSQPALAGIKHLNRMEQVLAATCCQAAGDDEALMLSQAGEVVSVVAGNLFLVRDGRLLTPALDDCGIQGTRRRAIIEDWAPSIGVPVGETRLTPADLDTADELLYCNSLTGVRAVGCLGDRVWRCQPVARALHDACCAALAAESCA